MKIDKDWQQNHFSFHPTSMQETNERYGKNMTFLHRCYGIDFAPIKRYCPFCFFMIVYKEAKIILLWSLSTVCPLFVCLSFFLFVSFFCRLSFFLYICVFFLCLLYDFFLFVCLFFLFVHLSIFFLFVLWSADVLLL